MIKDLLPLYVDGVCSEDSSKLVEKHLNECKGCSNYFEKMKDCIPESVFEVDNAPVIERYKKNIKAQMIGIAVLGLAAAALIIALGWLFMYTGSSVAQEYFTIDAKEYGNWDGHIDLEKEELYSESGLYVFPENISNAIDVDYFYYSGVDNHSISQYLIYAAVTYSKEDYECEKERLAKIKCDVVVDNDGTVVTNSIMYSEELFKYPSYVAVYASNLCYEYVLLDEENNQMIYIFSKLKDAQGIIPQIYLPTEINGIEMYDINDWENQNIYWSKDADGDYEFYNKY